MLGKVNWKPSPRDIRIFAAILVAGFGIISLILSLSGKTGIAKSVFGVALMAALLSALIPAIGRVLYLAWMAIGFCIGFVVSKVILVLIFYVVFTPVAIVFKLMKRDALARRKPLVDSYWTPHPRIDDKDSYSHLF